MFSMAIISHAVNAVPMALTSSALWTCLVHPDALFLVGVLITRTTLTAAEDGLVCIASTVHACDF